MGLWQRAGKPDFAACATYISRFDPTLRESLSRSESKVLQWFLFYLWTNSSRTGKDQTYTSFSQIEVGKKFGRSRWTIARAVDRLSAYGLISATRRRPKAGDQWQTNLYFVANRLKAILSRLLSKKAQYSPCSKSAPQESLKDNRMAGAPPSGCAASQDKEFRDGNEQSDTLLRSFLERAVALRGGNPLPA